MKKLALFIILLIALTACGSSDPADLPEDASQEDVLEGFDDFLEQKVVEDQALAEQELAEAQVRPVTFEPDSKQVHISIPAALIDEYGDKITECYTGSGTEEKIRAKGEYCVTQLAATNGEEQICREVLEQGESKDKCYQAIAKEQNDPYYCELIASDASKQACNEVVQ